MNRRLRFSILPGALSHGHFEGPVMQLHSSTVFVTVFMGLSCSNVSETAAADIKVLAATPTTAVIRQAAEQFERSTGHKITGRFVSGPIVKQEIDQGETFDVAVSITPVIDDLLKEGKIVAETRADFAYAPIGLGIQAGKPKPDIGSVEAFKRTLLDSKSVAHSAAGASGITSRDCLNGSALSMK